MAVKAFSFPFDRRSLRRLAVVAVFLVAMPLPVAAEDAQIDCSSLIKIIKRDKLKPSVTINRDWGIVRATIPGQYCREPMEEWRRRGTPWTMTEAKGNEASSYLKSLSDALVPPTPEKKPEPKPELPKPVEAPKPQLKPKPKPAISIVDAPTSLTSAPTATAPAPTTTFETHPQFQPQATTPTTAPGATPDAVPTPSAPAGPRSFTIEDAPSRIVIKKKANLPPPPADGSCDLDLETMFTAGWHTINGTPFWLAKAFTVDGNGDGVADNITFFLKADGHPDLEIHYLPPSQPVAASSLNGMMLADPTALSRICFGTETYDEPAPAAKPRTTEKVAIGPDLAAEMKAKEEGRTYGEEEEKVSSGFGWITWSIFGVLFITLSAGVVFFILHRRGDDDDDDEDDEDEDEDY